MNVGVEGYGAGIEFEPRAISPAWRDESDNRILECAVAGKADLIVSGDHHLQRLRVFEGIGIPSCGFLSYSERKILMTAIKPSAQFAALTGYSAVNESKPDGQPTKSVRNRAERPHRLRQRMPIGEYDAMS